MQSTRNNSTTLIPLSARQKFNCMTALKAMNIEALSAALVAAALPPLLHSFPGAMQARLGLLQEFYRTSPPDSELAVDSIKLITHYMQKEGVAEFIKILNQSPIEESAWNTSILEFLAKQLDIKINAEPVVQATIQAGKVYWRVMINNVVVHDRPAIKKWNVTFTEDNSWILDWKLFREFKDSGKRYSPVSITQERFAQWFIDVPEVIPFANLIWLELTQKGILSANKFRLTHHWRALSGIEVKLQVIESLPQPQDIKKQWYAIINQTLHDTANNRLYAERIEGVPDAEIFRPERVHKSWAGTGRVKQDPITVDNDPARSKVYATHRWDVAVHHELNAYRDSVFEKRQYQNVIMHYDHQPSSSILKNTDSPLKAIHDGQIANIDAQLAHYARFGYPTTKYNLRSNALTNEDVQHNNACNALEVQKNLLNKSFKKSTEDWAYCIAIPKALHKQSDTTLESKGDQLIRSGNPFVVDVTTSLTRLKKDPDNFGIKFFDDYLHALGAFRFLYRVQSKPATAAIANQVPIGRLASTFFQNPKDKEDLDKFFTQDVKEFISKREGLKK